MTDAVTKQRPSLRAIATSGSTASAGGSEDQIGSLPPSGANASPVAQSGPAPAGKPTRLLRHPVMGDAGATLGEVAEAVGAPTHHLGGRAESAEGKASVGLLPAEPAVRRPGGSPR